MKLKRMIPIYLTVAALFVGIAYYGSQTVSVVSGMIPIQREHIIIIDAGHGGIDGGATSCTGVLESRFNLEIALKLKDLFHLLGYQTKMIRESDISVYTKGDTIAQQKISDLKERVRIVNETENAVVLSIHQNTFPDSRYSGAQVFYSPEGEGQLLAQRLQDAFCQTVNPGSNRKSKKADGVYVMEHINCTGVLIECGFLSNPQEEAKLRTDAYQKNLSCVIAATVSNFLDQQTND